MKIYKTLVLAIALSGFVISFSCQKPDEEIIVPVPPPPQPPPMPPPLPLPPEITVTNRWEFDLDGVHYSGTIDTSWSNQLYPERSHPDTLLQLNGTSDDKLANLHLSLYINRFFHPASTVKPMMRVYMTFDTSSTERLTAIPGDPHAGAKMVIDTFSNGKFIADFSGTMQVPSNFSTNPGKTSAEVRNGRLSLQLGKGTGEPKLFSFSHPEYLSQHGYFNLLTLESNTLIMEGVTHSGFADQVTRLLIRTGGTIKPGVYEASEGDVGFSFYAPSLYRILTGSTESMRVIITSVEGNVIRGTFSGVSLDNQPISHGSFSGRVKNYRPQVDSMNKWSFNINNNRGSFSLYGGNMLKATLTNDNNRHQLKLQGESDHGASHFELLLDSNQPIKAGSYSNDRNTSDRLQEFTFRSPKKLWNGSNLYYYSNDSRLTTVQIDEIDDHHIKGQILGTINAGVIDNGKFSVTF